MKPLPTAQPLRDSEAANGGNNAALAEHRLRWVLGHST